MPTFAEWIRRVAEGRRHALPPPQHPEPLAALAYEDERAVKQQALEALWREHRLPGKPDAIVPAPVPRGYRATTKRKATIVRDRVELGFAGAGASRIASTLDRPDHVAVYAFLANALARASARALSAALNFAIVRGAGPRLAVILNVRVFEATVVRGAKQLAEALQAAGLGVQAAFLYLDPSGSDYYLEAKRPPRVLSWKRLFGPEWLEVAVSGRRLRFPPVVFSQINEPMLESMALTAADLLGPLPGAALLDLYCGYGLFALTIGREAAAVTGVDYDGPAIEAAQANAEHSGESRRVRFVAGRIDAELVQTRLRAARGREIVLLDPPRQGTEPGVVEAIAARGPERVLHVCCGTDEIPRELDAWAKGGYRLVRAVPMDLFAGTANLETLLQLEK
jgi:tRNA/tmRNA/rRNA uracil-C5-methylase (TrmA/RlmC/RlmD family)